MSTFTVSKNLIQPKISLCNQVCSSKDPVEVHTHIKLEIKAGILFVSALNPSFFYYHTSITLATATTDCVFAIKADMLTKAIDLIDSNDLEFQYNEKNQSLIVKGKNAKHTLRTNSTISNDFINPEEANDQSRVKLDIKSETLKSSILKTFISVGNPKNTYQPEFCNVCFSTDSTNNSLVVVSTDRFRITKIVPEFEKIDFNIDNSNFVEGINNFLLPPKSLKLVLSAIEETENVSINFENDFAWIKSGSTVMTLSYGQGNFPDYNRIIPTSFGCSFSINPKDLLFALKQVSLIGNLDTINKKVKLIVDGTKSEIKLVSENSSGESSESDVAIIDYQGLEDKWEQAFNSGYLSEYLATIGDTELLWESNPSKPSILSPKDQKDKELYLVSGLKV
jgi:DNA polymerase III subunit beta